jgi:alanyl-tRNA synthetase
MTTTRLYYDDAYLTRFDAVVVSSEPHEDAHHVVLDRTAFYPTSGGQPFDLGRLGDAIVRDVVDREDGEVVHVVDRAFPTGAAVTGQIDWRRRFDHMQQHTGQHVLSAAYDRLFDARTESFHLGAQSSSIDLARELTAEQHQRVEAEANRIVWEDRPIAIRTASAEEARSLPLRKESLREGSLRLVEVEHFDLSACGGTHVARTGAIGIIAVAGWEKFRGGTRVEFLCGHRALTQFREWRDALAATTRHLSVQPAELAAAVEKLQGESRQLQKTIRGQQEQLARHEAAALVARAERTENRLVLVEALENWDAAGLKTLATAATAQEPRLAVALFTTTTPVLAVIAGGPSSGIDANAALKGLIAAFGGKGGGRRELAQGSLTAVLSDVLAHARTSLRSPLPN